MKNKTAFLSSTLYSQAMQKFRAQLADVASIEKLYINAEKRVFAGVWTTSEGVISFCGGSIINAETIVTFVEGEKCPTCAHENKKGQGFCSDCGEVFA